TMQGTATKELFGLFTIGIYTLFATTTETLGTTSITVISGNPATLTLTANPQIINADSGTTTAYAYVKDQNNNPVADGTIVHFSYNPFIGTATTLKGTATLIATFTTTGTYTLIATTTEICATTSITVIAGAFSYLELKAPSTTTINATFTLTIVAKDKFGNPALTTGSASLTNTTNSIFPTTISLTNGIGIGIATIATSPNGGKDTITATYQGLTSQATTTAYINPGATLDIASLWGTVSLIETGSLSDSFIVCITDAKHYFTFTTNKPENGIGICIEVRLINTKGEEFRGSFTIKLEVLYNEDSLGSIREETLRLYTFNEQTKKWEGVSNSWVDPLRNIVGGILTHLTLIAPLGSIFALTNNDAYCYPNPWKKNDPSYGGKYIYFINLSKDSLIKVYNISGEEINRIYVDEPVEKWDVKGEDIASGVYIYTITGGAGGKKIGKIGIIK
ncbi:MAG: T9SS type A sorting domain-containing protein, partial [bacterium]